MWYGIVRVFKEFFIYGDVLYGFRDFEMEDIDRDFGKIY